MKFVEFSPTDGETVTLGSEIHSKNLETMMGNGELAGRIVRFSALYSGEESEYTLVKKNIQESPESDIRLPDGSVVLGHFADGYGGGFVWYAIPNGAYNGFDGMEVAE
jgi:hypothetical protein